jgi:hypothetical protein
MYRPSFHIRALIGAAAMVAVASAVALASASPASASRHAVAASTPACASASLVVWLNTQGSGAAGSSFYSLEFTNLSGSSCTLAGYPGVSGVDLNGHQLGSAASRNPQHKAVTVTISPRGSAHIVLRIVDASNYPKSTCAQVMAAGLRVYPPGQTASKLIPYPFLACSRSGPNYLSVEAVQPGLGAVD